MDYDRRKMAAGMNLSVNTLDQVLEAFGAECARLAHQEVEAVTKRLKLSIKSDTGPKGNGFILVCHDKKGRTFEIEVRFYSGERGSWYDVTTGPWAQKGLSKSSFKVSPESYSRKVAKEVRTAYENWKAMLGE